MLKTKIRLKLSADLSSDLFFFKSDLVFPLSGCDARCRTCDSAGACASCRDPTKVLLFGECGYDSCAHQYYLNASDRTCRGTDQ